MSNYRILEFNELTADISTGAISTNILVFEIPEPFRNDIKIVLNILKSYKVRKVILYGSVARGDFRTDSDLDICVEGLKDEVFFIALAECLISTEHAISLVDLKSIHGYFRERVLKEGKILYEQN